MSTSYDFFLSGSHDSSRALVESALTEQGFTLTPTPEGVLAKRGSSAMTFLLGGMAGKNFQVTFAVNYFIDANQAFVARLNSNTTAGAFKGGVIGAVTANNAFTATVDALGARLTAAGVLAGSLAN